MPLHPITAESFAIIDREVGTHNLSPEEYAIVRRAIHATADFDLLHLFQFGNGAIAAATNALKENQPAIADVRMVAMGIASTFKTAGLAPPHCCLDYVTDVPDPHPPDRDTRTAAGMRHLARQFPQGLFIIGNAPTALLALVDAVRSGNAHPVAIVGVPVGFVAVQEAKQALMELDVPYISVAGRKGGSPVAAAIVNALVQLAFPEL